MHIEVRTDRHVDGDADLRRQVGEEVSALLARFADRLTRGEVHLGDENAGRGGSTDLRCAMEARPAGARPVAVTHRAGTLEEAYRGAAVQLHRSLDSRLARVEGRRGRDTIRRSTGPAAPDLTRPDTA